MEIEPWMLGLYMLCGICFFIFLSVKITPRFAKRAILNGLKGDEGKAIMREIVLSAVTAMDEPLEIEGEPDASGKPTVIKTTIGAVVMTKVSQSIMYHFKMTFLGEKGRLSKELKGAANEVLLSQVPEQMKPLMASFLPLIEKHPVLGVVMAVGAQIWQAKQGALTASPGAMIQPTATALPR